MNNNVPIFTLPLKPSSFSKKGMFVASLFSDILADKISGKSITMLNMIDSYKDQQQFLPNFLKQYEVFGVEPENIISDISLKSKIYKLIDSLVDKKLIYSEEKNVFICPCGKVECLEESIEEQTGKTNFSSQKNNIPMCDICGQPCSLKKARLYYIPPLILI